MIVLPEWTRVRMRLRRELGDEIFVSWFEKSTGSSSSNIARLTVETKFKKSWIKDHFLDKLLACWRAENPEILNIEIIVDADNVRFERTANASRQTIESPSRRENKTTAGKTQHKDKAVCEIFLHRNAWANWISSDDRAHGSVVRVALLLAARYVNQYTGEIWPGWDRIGSETGLSRSSVARAIRWMQDKDYLEKTRRRVPGSSARHRLTLPSAEQWVAAQGDRENIIGFPQIKGVMADLERCHGGPFKVSQLWHLTPNDIQRLPRAEAADASDEALNVVSIEDWLSGSSGAA